MIVDPPHDTFMLKARSSGLCRWVDSLLVGGLELEDSSFVDEARESLFEDSSGCERPYGGPLSLDRNFRGGIEEGLRGHVAVMRCELEVEVEKISGVVEGAASCSGVLRCLYAS
jgi:hypothetical protein